MYLYKLSRKSGRIALGLTTTFRRTDVEIDLFRIVFSCFVKIRLKKVRTTPIDQYFLGVTLRTTPFDQYFLGIG